MKQEGQVGPKSLTWVWSSKVELTTTLEMKKLPHIMSTLSRPNTAKQITVKTQIKFSKNTLLIFCYEQMIDDYNPTPLDMYNRLSQVYCITPDYKRLNNHVDISSRIRGLNFGTSLHLHTFIYISCFVYVSSKGSGKSVHLHRLTWALFLNNVIKTKRSCAGKYTLKCSKACVKRPLSIKTEN